MKDGFEEVASLDCDVAYTIGGLDKKTGKKNPSEIEGYYIGAKQVPSTMAKSGFTPLHILLTSDGNVGVWGKTDLNRKLLNVTLGQYIAVEFSGMKKIKNFPPMYTYKVGVRKGDVIDVGGLAAPANTENTDNLDVSDSSVFDDSVSDVDDAPTYQAPVRSLATPPSATAQAKARALLGAHRKS